MFLPGRAFGTAMVFRSVVLWAGIRAASLGLGSPPTIGLHSVLVLFLVTFLSEYDTKILGERVLLGNLGVSPTVIRMFSLTPAVLAEGVLHITFLQLVFTP
jgi:hypothetical protein